MELSFPLELFGGDRPLVKLYLKQAVFSGRCSVVLVPLHVVTSSTGLYWKRCLSIVFLSLADRKIGVFWNVAPPTRPRLKNLRETGLILRCERKVWIPFQTNQVNRLSHRDQEGRRGGDEVVLGSSVFLSSETDMSGNFLGFIKGVMYHFKTQDGMWDFS